MDNDEIYELAEQNIEETIDVIEVPDTPEYDIDADLAFPPVGELNEELKHQLLNGRELPDQHPIIAVTGLREELDSIEALQVVYSNEKNQADYYLWEDENQLQQERAGRFVTLCDDTSKIRICTSRDDIFGVTTSTAAFVGGQDDIARDYKYGLVVYSGIAIVQCELPVEAGDYVIPDNYGFAKKSSTGYGYKVFALEKVGDIIYAIISLGIPANIIHTLSSDVEQLGDRMDAAEANVVAAMNVANAAYNKAADVEVSVGEAMKNAADALGKSEESSEAVDKFLGETAPQISGIAAQAIAIAEGAAVSAEAIRAEAVATANQALKDVNDSIRGWDATIEEMHNSINAAAGDAKKALENLDELSGELDETIADVRESIEGVSSDLNTAVDSMNKSLDDASANTKAALDEISKTIEDESDRLSQSFNNTIENEIKGLEESFNNTIDAEIDDLSKNFNNALDEEIKELSESFEQTISVEIDGLSKSVQQTIDGVNKTISDVDGKFVDLSKDLEPLVQWEDDDGHSSVAGFVAVANETATTLASIVEWKEDKGDGVVASLAGLSSKVDSQGATLNAVAQWKSDVENDVSSIAAIQQTADEHEATLQTVTKWKSDVESDVESITGISQTANQNKADISAIVSWKSDVEDSVSSIASIKQTADENKAELGSLAEWKSDVSSDVESIAGISQAATKNQADIASIANWKSEVEGSVSSIASIKQTADANKASIDGIVEWKSDVDGDIKSIASLSQQVEENSSRIDALAGFDGGDVSSVAGIKILAEANQAKINELVEWKGDVDGDIKSIASIKQTADANKAELDAVAGYKHGDDEGLAGLVARVDENKSEVHQLAQHNFVDSEGNPIEGAAGVVAQVKKNQSEVSAIAKHQFTKNNGDVVGGLAGLNAYVNETESNVSLVAKRITGTYVVVPKLVDEAQRNTETIYYECNDGETITYWAYLGDVWASVEWPPTNANTESIYYIAPDKSYWYYAEEMWKYTDDAYDAGLPVAMAGIQAVVDENKAQLDEMVKYDKDGKSALAGLTAYVDENSAHLSELAKYTSDEGDGVAGLMAQVNANKTELTTLASHIMADYDPCESWDEEDKNTDKIYYAEDTNLYWYYDDGWHSTDNAYEAGLVETIAAIRQTADSNKAELDALVSWKDGAGDESLAGFVSNATAENSHIQALASHTYTDKDEIEHSSVAALKAHAEDNTAAIEAIASQEFEKADGTKVQGLAGLQARVDENESDVALLARRLTGQYIVVQAFVAGEPKDENMIYCEARGTDGVSYRKYNGSQWELRENWEDVLADENSIYYITQNESYWYHNGTQWLNTTDPYEAGLRATIAGVQASVDDNSAKIASMTKFEGEFGESLISRIDEATANSAVLQDIVGYTYTDEKNGTQYSGVSGFVQRVNANVSAIDAFVELNGDTAGLAIKVDNNASNIAALAKHTIGEYQTVNGWPADTTKQDENAVYYDNTSGYFYYYKDGDWQSTTKALEAGLQGALAGVQQQADKNGARIETIASIDGEFAESLSIFVADATADNAEIQALATYGYTDENGRHYGAAGIMAEVDKNRSKIDAMADQSFELADGTKVRGLAGLNASVDQNASNVAMVARRLQGEYVVILENVSEENRDINRIYAQFINGGFIRYFEYIGDSWQGVVWHNTNASKNTSTIYYVTIDNSYLYYDSGQWQSTNDPYEAGLPAAIGGVQVVVDDHSSQIESLTSWQGDAKSSIAQVEQKADDNGAYIQSLVASVDMYSVGEYSQSYGLTHEQAKSIVPKGAIYIPTKHAEGNSHKETLSGTYEPEFTQGSYYSWDGDVWVEKSNAVIFFSDGDTIPTGTTAFWYIDSNTRPDGYEAHALYKFHTDQYGARWKRVAILAGNSSNRATSMIRQEVDRISFEVTNARGSYAGLDARLEADKEAQVAMVASVVGEDGKVTAASIINAVTDGKSSTSITADHIVLDGYNITNGNGSFQIDGDGKMIASGGSIGGWNIGTFTDGTKKADGVTPYEYTGCLHKYYEGTVKENNQDVTKKYRVFLRGDPEKVTNTVFGVKDHSNSDAGDYVFSVNYQGKLSAKNVEIEGKITATSGDIGGWTVGSFTDITPTETDPNKEYEYTGSLYKNAGKYRVVMRANYSAIGDVAFGIKEYSSDASDTLVQKGSWVFSVSHEGAIKATKGTIGGWAIKSGSIRSGDTSAGKGILLQTDGTYAFVAGSSNFSNNSTAKFRVKHDGEFTATDADITGKITATSGDIGGWVIGENGFYSEDEHTFINTDGTFCFYPVFDNDPTKAKWCGFLRNGNQSYNFCIGHSCNFQFGDTVITAEQFNKLVALIK